MSERKESNLWIAGTILVMALIAVLFAYENYAANHRGAVKQEKGGHLYESLKSAGLNVTIE